MIKRKILAIIYKENKNIYEYLALRNNPSDPRHGGDFYYVVTGGANANESLIDTVKREVYEETGIKAIEKITDIKKIYKYRSATENNSLCYEHIFLILIDEQENVKKLNEEHTDFLWLKREGFIKKIHWYYHKDELREILNHIDKK